MFSTRPRCWPSPRVVCERRDRDCSDRRALAPSLRCSLQRSQRRPPRVVRERRYHDHCCKRASVRSRRRCLGRRPPPPSRAVPESAQIMIQSTHIACQQHAVRDGATRNKQNTKSHPMVLNLFQQITDCHVSHILSDNQCRVAMYGQLADICRMFNQHLNASFMTPHAGIE